MARAISLSSLPGDTIGEVVEFLAENLRPSDLEEIEATLLAEPDDAIRASIAASSKAWVILDRHNTPIAVTGVAPSLTPGVGTPWLVATPGLTDEGFAFARQTGRIVDEMHEDYPVLTNFVDARNTEAINWLLFAGFRLIDADPRYGPEERLFIQFSRSN